MMKKAMTAAAAALMILLVLALTACGGGGASGGSGGSSGGGESEEEPGSKYIGTWKAIYMSIGGVQQEPDGEWFLILNEDGTGTLDVKGQAPSAFTWEPTSNGFKASGEMKVKFTDDGDRIKTKVLGTEIVFEKQD